MLPKTKNVDLVELFKKNRIIPVAVFNDLNTAKRTAELLLKNSIGLLEVTLRTGTAFRYIEEIRRDFPELAVGAGSVLTADALEKAINCGAAFGVAPCLDKDLVRFSKSKKIPFIPGIASPSELNSAIKEKLKVVKIFPALYLGGPDYINAVTAPFKMKDFYLIPTGGINEENIAGYLKAERVIACGTSYIADSKFIEKGDFTGLENRIKRIKELA